MKDLMSCCFTGWRVLEAHWNLWSAKHFFFFFFKAFLIFLFQSQKRFAGHVAKLPCLKGIKSPKMFKNLETVPAIKVFMGHWSSKGSLKEPAELSVSPPHLHRNMHLLVLEASRGNCKNKIQTTQLTNKIFGWACVYKVSWVFVHV